MSALNEPQRRAVACRRGPLLVNAGPGSGKTNTVIHRTAAILSDGVDPTRTLLVTFTRKAAKEMRSRLVKLVGREAARGLWAGTFHATCSTILRKLESDVDREGRRADYVIYDQDDSKALIKDAIGSLNLDVKIWLPAEVQGKISRYKNLGMEPHDIVDDGDELAAIDRAIWVHYEDQLRKSNGYDYDDLQLVMMRLLESGRAVGKALGQRFLHVTVDEYQDTNPVQFRLIRALAQTRNLCVVGDHRQSVYAFRGADVRNIRLFAEHYPDATVVDLDINYRSSPQIVTCFNAFFDDCQMQTPNKGGPPVSVQVCGTEEMEAQHVLSRIFERLDGGTPPGEIAVLYRVHALSRAIEDRLREAGVRYQVVGGLSFYERAEVKDVIAYLRLVENPHSSIDLQRVINVPRRNVSPKTLDKLRAVAHSKRSSMWDAIPSLLATDNLAPKTFQGVQRFMLAIKQAREDMHGKPIADDRPLDLFTKQPPATPLARKDELSLVTVAHRLLDSSGYREHWRAEIIKLSSKRKPVELERALQKQRNVEEVVAAIGAYQERVKTPTLAGFLEEVALMSDQDQLKGNCVSLMTVHASKGLEYDAVFLVGCEEGIIPFSKSQALSEIEEEKRLMFVACSRARKWLTLTLAEHRWMYGARQPTTPSRFLQLLPEPEANIDLALKARWKRNHIPSAQTSWSIVDDQAVTKP